MRNSKVRIKLQVFVAGCITFHPVLHSLEITNYSSVLLYCDGKLEETFIHAKLPEYTNT